MPCLESKRARRRPEGPAPTIIIWDSERGGISKLVVCGEGREARERGD
jgi:hypothetical protein